MESERDNRKRETNARLGGRFAKSAGARVLKRLVAQRRMIGWIAATALGGGLICWFFPTQSATAGGLLRVGVLLAALWLAIPPSIDEDRPPISIWKVLSLLGLLLAVVRRPWVLIPIGLVLALLSLFRKRSG